MPKQLCFTFAPPLPKEHGGSLLFGKRKTKRQISTKKPMHFILKSSKAKGIYSFVNYRFKIESLIYKMSHEHQIKVYEKAVNFNHIHLVVKLSDENRYKSWIRLLSAEIVELIQAEEDFFDQRPYSKIIEWGRQFDNVLNYQYLNQMEIVGLRH